MLTRGMGMGGRRFIGRVRTENEPSRWGGGISHFSFLTAPCFLTPFSVFALSPTSLSSTVSEEYLPVVRFLLSHKVASSSPSSSTAVSSTAVDVNATDTSGCSPLWVAAYNGVYSTAVLLLFAGAALDLKGKAHGTSVCTASTAARSMRNSSIANLIDAEEGMRKEDGEREGALRRGEVDERAFRVQLKEAVAASMSGKRK